METSTAKFTEAGLNLIQQALSIFDRDLRLAVCNRRYQEMFGLPDALVAPGAPFEETIRYLVGRGEYGPQLDPEAAGAEPAALVPACSVAREQRAAVSVTRAHRAVAAGQGRASVAIAAEERSGSAAAERGAPAEAAGLLVAKATAAVRGRCHL